MDDVLPIDPQIIIGRLENGLTYYVKYNGVPENRCELRLVVNAGSILEEDDQQGLAHFVEHMAFNGSEHFEKQELVNFLESIGMRFGPEINAYTSFDETVYMLQLATDSVEILKKGFLVLYDWAQGLTFDSLEIEKERGVIIEEWRLGQGASSRMRDQQFPILFQGSRYAQRLPIGQKAVLDTFRQESLRRFYRDWYHPDLMAVIAVGDFNPDSIEAIIVEQFGSIPVAANKPKREIYPIPDHRETLFAIASDPEATQSGVSIYYKLPDQEEERVRDYRRMLMEGLYSDMLNQRLAELSRQSDPPFVYAYSGKGQFVRSRQFFTLAAMVKEGGIPTGLQALLTEAERVRQFGFTETELAREKLNMLRSMESIYNERDKTNSAAFADEYTRHFLFDEPIPGIPFEYYVYRQFIPGITLDEVNALSAFLMPDSNQVLLIDGPQKDEVPIPDEESLRAIIAAVQAMELSAYEDDMPDRPLITDLPPAGAIVNENTIEELDVTEWQLANGVRVILKPTTFKNDEIRMSAFSPGGLSLIPDSLLIPAKTSVAVITQGGLDDLTDIQLNKWLSGKMVSVSPYIGAISEGFSGSSSVEDLEILFQLVYQYFYAPRADSSAFVSYKLRLAAFFENRSLNPEAVFRDTLQALITQNHPRYKPLDLPALDQMDLTLSYNIYRDRFADASDFTFLFTGNFTLEGIKPLVERYLANLPNIGRRESWQPIAYDFPPGVVERTVRKGIEPKSKSAIIFAGDFEWSPENRYVARSLIDALNIKLRERIREDLGGTYGISASIDFDRYPRERYEIAIEFGSDPQRVDELTSEIFSQIDSLIEYGTQASYLQKVTEAQRRHYELGLKSNSFWLNNLEFRYFHDLDPRGILDYLQLVGSLSLQDIQEAAVRYLNKQNFVRVVLYPENE